MRTVDSEDSITGIIPSRSTRLSIVGDTSLSSNKTRLLALGLFFSLSAKKFKTVENKLTQGHTLY